MSDSDLKLIISPHFTFVERGLVITGNPSLDEWGQTWQAVQYFDEDMLPYIIGDLLAYGELTYGQAHAQFLKPNGQGRYSNGSLRNLKYTFSRWPLSRRRYAVPWTYYQDTASLPEIDQDRAMQQLIEGKRAGLRAELRRINGGQQPNPPARPDDTIEELRQDNFNLQQENARQRAEIERMKSTQAAAIEPPAIAPDALPDYAVHALGHLENALVEFGYSSVTIYQNGDVRWSK